MTSSSDSYFNDVRPCCFTGVKVCSAVDSSYCTVCDRWLEAPYSYISRADKHPTPCKEWTCKPNPVCKCNHSMKAHGRSMRAKDAADPDILERFISGPHSCDECDCEKWEADG